MTERRKPEDEGRGDADELDRAVEAEVYRLWREARDAGWDYIPSKAKARERLTAPERERQQAEEARRQERREAEEDRLRELRLAAAEREASATKHAMGRPLKALPASRVARAAQELKKRGALPAAPRSGPHTYVAIAQRVRLNRDRVKQIDDLMKLGWPLRESHPDFPAAPDYVRLPTPQQAARLLRSA